VAAILAVLASENIPHPNLEALLTVDEETGMTGAFGLKPDLLQGNILFNLDSEDEGELYIGCAGGVNCTANFTYTGEELPEGFSTYKIEVTGFRGGHSGLDIHLGRGNANKSMNRILWNLHQTCGMRLSTLKGGSLRNAIPRESFAWVAIPNTQTGKMEELLKRLHSEISEELKFTEPDFKLEYTESPLKDNLLEADTALALYRAIYACPNGPIRMNDQIPTLTETSTNLAIVTVKKGNIIAKSLLRSFVDSAKIELQHAVESVFLLAGATVVSDGEYPGWRPNPNSEILELLGALYKSKWNIQPQVKAIHAGLECGILGAAYPNWDMISFGPTIRYPHSPDEKVNVASVAKF
jgi:dipeptidase D